MVEIASTVNGVGRDGARLSSRHIGAGASFPAPKKTSRGVYARVQEQIVGLRGGCAAIAHEGEGGLAREVRCRPLEPQLHGPLTQEGQLSRCIAGPLKGGGDGIEV